MTPNSTSIVALSFDEIDDVAGAELTAAEVRDIGIAAVGTGAAVAAVCPPAGAAIAAVGATATLIGGLIDGMGAG